MSFEDENLFLKMMAPKMSNHVLSVCIFCFICATHTPCASHAAVKHHSFHHKEYSDPMYSPLIEKFHDSHRDNIPNLGKNSNNIKGINHRKVKRSSDSNNKSDSVNNSDSDQDHLRKIFLKYGDGDFMTKEGFKKFLGDLNLSQFVMKDENHHQHEDHDNKDTHDYLEEKNTTCFEIQQIATPVALESSDEKINETSFYKMCPILLYNLVNKDCIKIIDDHHIMEDENAPVNNSFVWMCSILAIVIISACGVLSLAIIPVMQKRFYKPLIQFLVALAVGTLAGDALLHLLPHAMSTTHGRSHSHSHHSHLVEDNSHDENIQKGCVAMLGLTFFFVMERLISLCVKWWKGKQKKHSHVTVIDDRRESIDQKNETQCMDKYNSFPYCYKDIMDNPHNNFCETDKTATTVLDPGSKSDSQKVAKSSTLEKLEPNNQNLECPSELNICTEANKMLTPEHKNDDYTVIVTEHKSEHHGHSHKHGHVHSAPKNFSSVAWMVIMGDGLHNFTDGMAIGAAFSGSLAGGFSTTVAVFCHELPHELGDFAMLLKAGMTIKQAMFYNILSSVLCIFGNIAGLILGNTEYASSWVFAAAAGMFIYIALVDMIPELSSAHEDEGNVGQAILHLGGLLSGLGIMALIAFYEHDLMTVFSEN
ncbi:zinc transporter foi isoform X1 [Diorhabda sublineata]|uniref:zinc transporter foi isoform X1 n=2 Tax=Diorhabda sublineata TaxID=1163346 RepID=UPI0024E066FD|nr:zinc transporter foi isoform X1 [Diorhabda sublineata]